MSLHIAYHRQYALWRTLAFWESKESPKVFCKICEDCPKLKGDIDNYKKAFKKLHRRPIEHDVVSKSKARIKFKLYLQEVKRHDVISESNDTLKLLLKDENIIHNYDPFLDKIKELVAGNEKKEKKIYRIAFFEYLSVEE